jgi:hypothetical protein
MLLGGGGPPTGAMTGPLHTISADHKTGARPSGEAST